MKELASRFSYRLMVLMACFTLATVAVGCGDDDGDGGKPDAGDGGPDSGPTAGRAGAGRGGAGAGGRDGGAGRGMAGTDGDTGTEEGMDGGN